MKKSMIVVVYILFFATLNASYCDKLFNKYKIDPKIKSITGWKRIVNQDRIELHIPDLIINDFGIKECLIENGLNIKKYNRSIGDKL